MISSEQSPESLVKRIRALADKRQKQAAKESRVVAQNLIGAAHGYRAIADALERQPSLPWLKRRNAPDADAELEDGALQTSETQ